MTKKWIAGLSAAVAITGLGACSDADTGGVESDQSWRSVASTTLGDLDSCSGEPETQLPCQQKAMDRFQTDGYRLPESSDGTRALTAAEAFQKVYADSWGAGKCTPPSTTVAQLSCPQDVTILADNIDQLRSVLQQISQS